MNQPLLDKIVHVRRQTRSADILEICNELEKRLLLEDKPRFDRTTYQRELMRKRRAEAKAKANKTPD